MSDSEDPIDAVDEGDDNLFGDDDDDEGSPPPASPKEQAEDSDGLASDPDEDSYARRRRRDDDDEDREPEHDVKQNIIIDMTAYRHPVPKPTDGSLRALRVPKFLRFHPEEHRDDFEPSEFDLANAQAERPVQVTRFRKDESTGHLHSNTNVLRWSDGSMTISVGGEQFEIQKKPLAPPPNKPYNEMQDTHYYAAAAELASNMLITVGHVTEQYNVRPNNAGGDEALTYFKQSMAKERKAGTTDVLYKTTIDPELQKKKAEQLEKERMKAQRKQENAQARQEFGVGRPGRGGLSINALEGGRRDRKRGAPGEKPKRRRPEYDSDDDLPQGVGRHENYDLDDGFLVGSDEEDEEMDDEDDILDEVDEAPKSKRQRTAEPEDDEDASGDEVEPVTKAAGKSRRRVVSDDEDED